MKTNSMTMPTRNAPVVSGLTKLTQQFIDSGLLEDALHMIRSVLQTDPTNEEARFCFLSVQTQRAQVQVRRHRLSRLWEGQGRVTPRAPASMPGTFAPTPVQLPSFRLLKR